LTSRVWGGICPLNLGVEKSVYVRFVWHDVFPALTVDAEFEGCFSCLKASAQALCCLTSFNVKSVPTHVKPAVEHDHCLYESSIIRKIKSLQKILLV